MKGLIRPWYRSRLLWLGVPGMIFLVWAWVDSIDHAYCFYRRGSVGSHVLVSGAGAILFENHSWKDFGPRLFGPPEVDFTRQQVYRRAVDGKELPYVSYTNGFVGDYTYSVPSSPWIRKPVIWRKASSRFDKVGQHLTVAYWLLVAGYAVVWATAVILWQRRKARLERHPATPAA